MTKCDICGLDVSVQGALVENREGQRNVVCAVHLDGDGDVAEEELLQDGWKTVRSWGFEKGDEVDLERVFRNTLSRIAAYRGEGWGVKVVVSKEQIEASTWPSKSAAGKQAPQIQPPSGKIDLDTIQWKAKGGKHADPSDSWAWAFAYDQDGNLLPETSMLVETILMEGKVSLDGYTITLGGRDKRLLNRKKEG